MVRTDTRDPFDSSRGRDDVEEEGKEYERR